MTGGYLEPVWLALVDDDPATRNSVSWLCDEAGIELNCFENASSFLAALPEDRPVSVLLDYQMPVTNGLEALALIKIRTPHAAILMLTGFGSVPLAMTSVGQGAYTFVEKPFNDMDLLSKIQEGLRLAEDQFVDHLATSGADARLATLTSREREVFDLVAVGHASKVIADRLGLATKTVEVHRSRAMLKLGVTTMADILELAKQGTPAAPA